MVSRRILANHQKGSWRVEREGRGGGKKVSLGRREERAEEEWEKEEMERTNSFSTEDLI